MNACIAYPCQRGTGGCPVCDPKPPALNVPQFGKSLSDYTDDEIAREYHARALRKLGDPRVCIGMPLTPALEV